LSNPKTIERLARHTGVHSLIENIPHRHDTQLGRRFGEHDLSGGQSQHIVVTRVFAKDAKLLILDEPSSNLDAKTEAELFAKFKDLAQEKRQSDLTSFSTVKMADRIIVLDNVTLSKPAHTES
jgi:ATP-binding cassette subfamily B protein